MEINVNIKNNCLTWGCRLFGMAAITQNLLSLILQPLTDIIIKKSIKRIGS